MTWPSYNYPSAEILNDIFNERKISGGDTEVYEYFFNLYPKNLTDSPYKLWIKEIVFFLKYYKKIDIMYIKFINSNNKAKFISSNNSGKFIIFDAKSFSTYSINCENFNTYSDLKITFKINDYTRKLSHCLDQLVACIASILTTAYNHQDMIGINDG